MENAPKSPREKMVSELAENESFKEKDGSVLVVSLLGHEEEAIYRMLEHVRSGKIERLQILKDMVGAYRAEHLPTGGATSSTENVQIAYANWLGNQLAIEEGLHDLSNDQSHNAALT